MIEDWFYFLDWDLIYEKKSRYFICSKIKERLSGF